MLELNKIYCGDCLEVIKNIDDNSIDSIVTDPPYELGFMGKSWDSTGIANNVDLWRECLRVLKPGGHLLSFSGTRTYHRMASAIEDAGFEIRDMIEWVYGSGFPKSLNIGKAVDKRGGQSVGWFGKRILDWRKKNNITLKQLSIAIIDLCKNEASAITTINNRELNKNLPTASQFTRIIKEFNLPFNNLEEVRREIIGINDNCGTINSGGKSIFGIGAVGKEVNITKGTSEREGRGTQLKPAHEPICMARKPLAEKTVAENCLKWGTGGINIEQSRVETNGEDVDIHHTKGASMFKPGEYQEQDRFKQSIGRFPSNLIHDNSEEVRECFPDSKAGSYKGEGSKSGGIWSESTGKPAGMEYGDNGNASRFFKSILYYPKASKSERNKGLDGQVLITIMGVLLFTTITECTEKPDQNQLHLLDIEVCPQKEGLECEIKISKGKDLSISLYEKLITDQSLNECKSIISTTTNGTMTLAILNWLTHCITREYTADVNGEIEFGENLVENAEGGKRLTTTIKGRIEFLHDVKNAASEMQLIIKERENKNYHSTVKPIALIEYLIKMVTPKGGTVLDPFAGSGTTLVAAKKNGYQYIGCELTEEYIPIIEARLNATPTTFYNLLIQDDN